MKTPRYRNSSKLRTNRALRWDMRRQVVSVTSNVSGGGASSCIDEGRLGDIARRRLSAEVMLTEEESVEDIGGKRLALDREDG